jgi:hypothetical protein
MFAKMGYLRGTRDKYDASYQRPLKLENAAERWDSQKV